MIFRSQLTFQIDQAEMVQTEWEKAKNCLIKTFRLREILQITE